MGFFKWDDIPRTEGTVGKRKGKMRRVFCTEGLTIVRSEVEAGSELIERSHRHPEEQVMFMLEGKLRLRIGDEVGWVEPGEMAYFPPNVYHGGVEIGPEGAVYLQIFSPGKVDYLPGYFGVTRTEFKQS